VRWRSESPPQQTCRSETFRSKRTFRQASFIDTRSITSSGSLIEGIVIVSVVMVLFLMKLAYRRHHPQCHPPCLC